MNIRSSFVGCLHVKLKDAEFDVAAGQAIIVEGRGMGTI